MDRDDALRYWRSLHRPGMTSATMSVTEFRLWVDAGQPALDDERPKPKTTRAFNDDEMARWAQWFDARLRDAWETIYSDAVVETMDEFVAGKRRGIESDFDAKLDALRASLQAEIGDLRATLMAELAAMRDRVGQLANDLAAVEAFAKAINAGRVVNMPRLQPSGDAA